MQFIFLIILPQRELVPWRMIQHALRETAVIELGVLYQDIRSSFKVAQFDVGHVILVERKFILLSDPVVVLNVYKTLIVIQQVYDFHILEVQRWNPIVCVDRVNFFERHIFL